MRLFGCVAKGTGTENGVVIFGSVIGIPPVILKNSMRLTRPSKRSGFGAGGFGMVSGKIVSKGSSGAGGSFFGGLPVKENIKMEWLGDCLEAFNTVI